MLALLLLTLPAPAEVGAVLRVGWDEYGDLWAGDAVLGGFDLSSPAEPLDRLVVYPWAEATAYPGERHRLRLRADGRALRRATVLDADLEPVPTWTSDGVPVEEAWRERLFLDEASWRWRPRGDPGVELWLGVLPLDAADGRLMAESWPAARARVDAGWLGGPPVAAEAWVAATTAGSVRGALRLAHEPSAFEAAGIEVAATVDPHGGLAPVVEDDLGLLVELWRRTSAGFIDPNEDRVLSGLYGLYGE